MLAQVLSPALGRNGVLVGAALLAVLAFYVLAMDQGLLFSIVQGNVAFDQKVLHEVLHDARHAAGFPCH